MNTNESRLSNRGWRLAIPATHEATCTRNGQTYAIYPGWLATRHIGSDRYGYQIVELLDERTITVKRYEQGVVWGDEKIARKVESEDFEWVLAQMVDGAWKPDSSQLVFGYAETRIAPDCEEESWGRVRCSTGVRGKHFGVTARFSRFAFRYRVPPRIDLYNQNR